MRHCAQTCLNQVIPIFRSFKLNITYNNHYDVSSLQNWNIYQEEKRKMEAAI